MTEMRRLEIDESCARKLFYWLKKLQEEDRWYHDFETRVGNLDGEAQYAGRLRLINYLLFMVEDNIPKQKED